MKKSMVLAGICGVMLLSGWAGCASMVQSQRYAEAAKGNDFGYYFPSHDFVRGFATVDEAYDYVQTATAKFSQTAGKKRAKGLGAKLSGPAVTGSEPVTVGGVIFAENQKPVDFSKIEGPMEKAVKDAISASLLFLVFYGDRAVSISNFYLKDGYVYTRGNAQIRRFEFQDNRYDADYPVAWGVDQAFGYLRGGAE
jgi:hypothetical protein